MKKGFTLIELLAVIVILAIIALIATPIILNIINDSKGQSNEINKELYLIAVEEAIARKNLFEEFNPSSCEVQIDGNLICIEDIEEINLTIEVDGTKPCGGTIEFNNGKIEQEFLIFDNEYINPLKLNNYVKDDLLLFLDGKCNTRNGYDKTSLIWEDLSENSLNISLENFNSNPWSKNRLVFDKNNNYLSDINIDATSALTFQFVLKYNSVNSYMNIFENSSRKNLMLWIDPQSHFEINAIYNVNELNNNYSNKTILVTVTSDTTNSNIYINNKKIDYNFSLSGELKGKYTLFNRSKGQNFKGEVFGIRIYKKILTEEEINLNYKIDKRRFNLNDID